LEDADGNTVHTAGSGGGPGEDVTVRAHLGGIAGLLQKMQGDDQQGQLSFTSNAGNKTREIGVSGGIKVSERVPNNRNRAVDAASTRLVRTSAEVTGTALEQYAHQGSKTHFNQSLAKRKIMPYGIAKRTSSSRIEMGMGANL